MESVRTTIKIAENNFQSKEYEQEDFLIHTYQNYIQYCESLYSSFFTGNNKEVQRRIIRNNFGLTNEEIQSWEEKATRYKMSPESFSFSCTSLYIPLCKVLPQKGSRCWNIPKV